MATAQKPRMTIDEIRASALANGYEAAAVYAVGQVEGSGDGFDDNGFPDILFERHIMYGLLVTKKGQAYADSQAKLFPNIVNPQRTPTGGYGAFSAQGTRLDAATRIDRDCALQSCSWGRFQVLGKWYTLLGYKTVQDFVNDMCASEKKQMDVFLKYCQKVAPAAGQALKALDFKAFAIAYNGKSTNGYAPKILAEYQKAKAAKI